MYVHLHTRPDEITKFFTGFPSFQILCATFQVIQPTAEKMFSWSQLQRLRNKGTEEVDQLRDSLSYDWVHLTKNLQINLVFPSHSKSCISFLVKFHVFRAWNKKMPIWPSREKIQKHMPECFKHIYPRWRGIIDASEIKTEAPSSLVLNSELYSSYKSHTTVKGNIVISPSGEVIHVSGLFFRLHFRNL